MQVSRRNFLRGMGIGVAGAAVGMRVGFDAAPAAAQTAPVAAAFYRTTLGDFEITVIRDAVATLGLETLVANAESGEVNDLLAASGFPTGEQPNNFKQLLVNTGSELVLFDTGLGQDFSQLVPTLELIGVSPADITTVILSHWHPDHIGGVAPGGEVAFANAQYLISETEWAFLNDTGSDALATLQPVVDTDQIAPFADGDELVSGITAMAAPGHTPGHTGFMISSGDQVLMNTVDAIIHPVISVQRPDWAFGFDADPEQATSTRRRLLDQIATDNTFIFGYHFPFPGIGVIAAEGDDRWRFTPFSY